jgi:hypothetical protein
MDTGLTPKEALMTVTEIVQTIRDLGVAIAVALGLAYFVYKAVWPFVVKQVEDSQEARAEERAQFLGALERRDAEFSRMVSALNELTVAVREIQQVIRNR